MNRHQLSRKTFFHVILTAASYTLLPNSAITTFSKAHYRTKCLLKIKIHYAYTNFLTCYTQAYILNSLFYPYVFSLKWNSKTLGEARSLLFHLFLNLFYIILIFWFQEKWWTYISHVVITIISWNLIMRFVDVDF